MELPTTFTSDGRAPGDVMDALAAAGYEVGSARTVHRTLLDTFDGRLHAAGLRLELRAGRGRELVLTARDSSPARVKADSAPRLAGDLPAGPFRSRLAGILDIRALLPVLRLTSRELTAVRRDGAGKALVRVTVHDQLAVEHPARVPAGWVVEVEEVAGYAKEAGAARRLLRTAGLSPAAADLMAMAASAAGVDLAGVSGSPTVRLDPHEAALGAYRRVLANLADAVDVNWQGTVDDIDPEFLHDLRVAVRRTRSVLSQAKRVLPPGVRDEYRVAFGWLGTETGRARDLDVYVIEWDDYVAPLGADVAASLGPVLAHIIGLRADEHGRLAEVLRSPRYGALLAGWRGWLGDPDAGETEKAEKQATWPIGRVAADRIGRAQEALLARGRAIGPDTVAEELHELRKDAKKLRYLLECFGGLYAPASRKAFVQRLKALQDNLGEHQDAEVHANELRAMSAELHGRPGVGPATLVAMGQLTEHLERRRRSSREEYAERFTTYDTRQTRATLAELLGPAGG